MTFLDLARLYVTTWRTRDGLHSKVKDEDKNVLYNVQYKVFDALYTQYTCIYSLFLVCEYN